MPVLKNISGCRICLQNGIVVLSGKTVYVSSVDSTEVSSAISCGLLKIDDGLSDIKETTSEINSSTEVSECQTIEKEVPGNKFERVKGYDDDVYNPNDDDNFEIIDGVKILKEDNGKKFDPSIFIDA